MSTAAAAAAATSRAAPFATRFATWFALPATALLAAAAGLAVGGGWAEPELIPLMRFMAAIKALITAGAGAAVAWRLVRPAPPAASIAYGLAIAAMGAGSGLIWSLHAAAGACAVHGGLATLLLIAAIDRRGWAQALSAATARSPAR